MRRVVLLVLLAVPMVVFSMPAALAQTPDDAKWAQPVPGTNGPGVEAGRRPGGGDGESGGPSRCVYRRTAESDQLADTLVHPPGEGTFLLRVCDGDEANATYEWVPQGAAADPRTVAEQAVQFLELGAPRIAFNPPVGQEQFVNVETWLWLEGDAWSTRSATASVPGVSATVTAEPVSVTWSMGDGRTKVCRGPGRPYDPARPAAAQRTDCSYTYRRGSARQPGGAYIVSATMTWQVSWTSTVGLGGALDPEARTAQAPLRVAEIQALN